MFTGLVDHLGKVEKQIKSAGCLTLQIRSRFLDIVEGESIAVNGVCLTAISPHDGLFTVEISPETVNVTTFGCLEDDAYVNLERSLRVGDKLGGHFVTGHVDSLAKVIQIEEQGEFWLMGFECPEDLEFVVHKGSIAINGVSLTVNQVNKQSFSVMLIPHTLSCTNLSTLTVGSVVNIEFDMLAKFVQNSLRHHGALK